MKSIIKVSTLVFAVMFLSSAMLLAQEHKEMHKTDKTHQMMDAKKIDKNNDGLIYECPMKCEAPSDEPGECSKCGMKLVEVSVGDTNKEIKSDGKENSSCCEHEVENDKSKITRDHSKMYKSIVRDGVIDVKSIDINKDGNVFQDAMHWNVISDKAGKCPLCYMTLKEVTIEEAIKNLHKHGFKIK